MADSSAVSRARTSTAICGVGVSRMRVLVLAVVLLIPLFLSSTRVLPPRGESDLRLSELDSAGSQGSAPMKRTGIYIIQSKDGTNVLRWPLRWLMNAEIDILVGYFGETVDPALAAIPGISLLHTKGTTWTSGRNMLLQEALRMEARRGVQYTFFMFADGDILLQIRPDPFFPGQYDRRTRRTLSAEDVIEQSLARCSPTHMQAIAAMKLAPAAAAARRPYTYLECLLLEYQAPMTSPAVMPSMVNKSILGEPVFVMNYHDGAFNAFHRRALPVLLPYATLFDSVSWWASQAVLLQRAKCVYNQMLLFNWLHQQAEQPNEHSKYPRLTGSHAHAAAINASLFYLPPELSHPSLLLRPIHRPNYIPNMMSLSFMPPAPLAWAVHPRCSLPQYSLMNVEHEGFEGWDA
eukprot:m.35435 g.35435  ORF g.35435 m.35435 type:complete len:406 (-) comp5325_c0_seq1:233-1450(-)